VPITVDTMEGTSQDMHYSSPLRRYEREMFVTVGFSINRLLKYNFHVILNEVKDLSTGWKYEILRCAQNGHDRAARTFSATCKKLPYKQVSVKVWGFSAQKILPTGAAFLV